MDLATGLSVLIPFVFLGLVLYGLWWLLGRTAAAHEVFRIEIRAGEVRVVHGKVEGGLVSDIRELVAGGKLERATIRAVKDARMPRGIGMRSEGLDGRTAQRLRNIFALHYG